MGQRLAEQPEDDPPMTEPFGVAPTFIEGVRVERAPYFVRITGWSKHVAADDDTAEERRIVARATLPLDAAHELLAALQKALKKDGN
jgi:hypothetical protein